MDPPPSSSESESESDQSQDTATPIESVLSEFKTQVTGIEPALSAIEQQLQGIEKRLRASANSTEWLDRPMTPRSTEIRSWCNSNGLGTHPSLRSWFRAILKKVIVCDLESRTLLFQPEEAKVWAKGSPSLPLFSLLREAPTWFRLPAPL